MARSLVVDIVGDASSLERELKKANAATEKFNRNIQQQSTRTRRAFAGIGKAAVGAFAAVGVTAAVKSAVSAASDLEQQVSKTDVVFAGSAKQVQDWSGTLVKSFGLSRREALTTASGFGALFAPMGIVGDQAAQQSERLTELGADLASFYNTDVASALDAVRSGIVGESEPLRRYGVQLSEVRVQQEALRQTGKTHVADLTVQEKTLARIAIIWADTAKAQGDFGRTADTAANQLKIFNAEMENFKASVGGGVLPVLTRLLTFLNRLGPTLNKAAKMWRIFFFSVVSLALRAFTLIVEPFSHLPGVLGGWARKAKEEVQGELKLMNAFIQEQNAKTYAQLRAPVIVGKAIAAVQARVAAISGDGGKAGKAPTETKTQRQARQGRIRAAQEAFRQMLRDRADFAVEKAGATKSLKDDLAALRRYNALLSKQIKGGHGTLELEREQFRVQMQIADVLKRQADLAKKTRKRLGVDVTRFQKSARGQYVIPGGGGRGIAIAGGVHLYGIQNVGDLENQLARRSKQRAHQRRRR